MNTATLAQICRRQRRIIALLGCFCLAGVPAVLHPADANKPANAAPAPQAKLSLDNTQVDPTVAQREGLFDVAVVKKPVKKVAFESVKVDPRSAERAGLWNIDVAAGCGITNCEVKHPDHVARTN